MYEPKDLRDPKTVFLAIQVGRQFMWFSKLPMWVVVKDTTGAYSLALNMPDELLGEDTFVDCLEYKESAIVPDPETQAPLLKRKFYMSTQAMAKLFDYDPRLAPPESLQSLGKIVVLAGDYLNFKHGKFQKPSSDSSNMRRH